VAHHDADAPDAGAYGDSATSVAPLHSAPHTSMACFRGEGSSPETVRKRDEEYLTYLRRVL